MLNATLNKNMIDILREFKNSKFISFECGKEFNCIGGNLRITTDGGAVELTNFHKSFNFFDEREEVAVFEIMEVDINTHFIPYCITQTEKFDVNEKILAVEIINDYISVNNGEYEFLFDQAIIIKTLCKTVMFSKQTWFSEVIIFSENDDYDSVFPISEVEQAFSDYGTYSVTVKRTKKVL